MAARASTVDLRVEGLRKQKKERHLVIAGAALVFFTFVVKDIFIELEKEKVASLAAARSSIQSRREANALQRGVAQFRVYVGSNLVHRDQANDLKRPDVNSRVTSRTMASIVEKEIRVLEKCSAANRDELEEVLNVSEKLRKKNQLADIEIQAARRSFRDFEGLKDRIAPDLKKALREPADDPKIIENGFANLDTLSALYEGETPALERLENRVTTGIEDETIRSERWLKGYILASYVLYIVGWGLALQGQLRPKEPIQKVE